MEKDTKTGAGSVIEDIVARRGIYYQAFGIYKEVGGFYDYGPIGFRIKRNIENTWRRIFVDSLGSLELETTIVMPEQVFRASGHLDAFTDPITSCLKCNSVYRADKLLEEFYAKKGEQQRAMSVEKMSTEELNDAIHANKMKCEKCGGELSKVKVFNMMFKTQVGHGGDVVYLRPETAQGIFVDFRNLFKMYGLRLPIGIAQVGKVFRNEISPRQHLVRLREITQMEIEIFFDPGEEADVLGNLEIESILKTKIEFFGRGEERASAKSIGELLGSGKIPNRLFAVLIYLEDKLLNQLGLSARSFRFREIEIPPHYSKANIDLEINTGYGYIEVAGNAYRTDFDLSSHARVSRVEMSVVNGDRKVVPHVVEASIGVDRLLFALLDNSAHEDKERGWNWLRLNESVAPFRYAVFPLQKDDELVAKARELSASLMEKGVQSYYSDSGSIGKRYARADEIGVPCCITIDYQTLEDNTVTMRDRDTAKQVRRRADEI